MFNQTSVFYDKSLFNFIVIFSKNLSIRKINKTAARCKQRKKRMKQESYSSASLLISVEMFIIIGCSHAINVYIENNQIETS